jgi:hypothetical protein
MYAMQHRLRERLKKLSQKWIDEGIPTHEGVARAAGELEQWKRQGQIHGLWKKPPRMITATLDDGMGHGLALIERYAGIMGLTVNKMGLLQRPQDIVALCRREVPDFLGLTVLQLDSDHDLECVGRRLPARTCLVAGGAAFKTDPDLAVRCRVDFVAKNVAYFVHFVLDWSPAEAISIYRPEPNSLS